MSVADLRSWMLRNPGLVWATVLFGGVVAYRTYRWIYPAGPRTLPPHLREQQMLRFEADKALLREATRNFFFDGDLQQALQLFVEQMANLVVVIEEGDDVTTLSKVWATKLVQDMVCQFPVEPGQVFAVRVSPSSAEGKMLRSVFNISTVPAVLAVGGAQNLLVPGPALSPEVFVNVLLRLREQPQTAEIEAHHKQKGEWIIQQLLLVRGVISINDFVAEPAPGDFTSTSLTEVPGSVFEEDTPDSRAMVRAQQEYEYQQALNADKAQEAERGAAEAERVAAANQAAREQEEQEMAEAIALSNKLTKQSNQQAKRQLLPSEPMVGEMSGIATIVFRVGNQDPFTRRFRPTETMQDLHDFLFVEKGLEDCRFVVTGLGAGVLEDRMLTVMDAKLAPKTQVIVQSTSAGEDEEDEDDY